jgi:hypothetical protein
MRRMLLTALTVLLVGAMPTLAQHDQHVVVMPDTLK